MKILVVLVNYRRPQNIPRCISAWRQQTVSPYQIVVVDNAETNPRSQPPTIYHESYPRHELGSADDVWRIGNNLGPSCHFLPALAMPECEYTLFADEDLAPGRKCIEHLIDTARSLHNNFAALGYNDHCRRFLLSLPAGLRYRGNGCPPRSGQPEWCHIVGRLKLVNTKWVQHYLTFRDRLQERFGEEGLRLAAIHEDMMVCLGIQMAVSNTICYGVPYPTDPEKWVDKRNNLPEEPALWRRPSHFVERNRMVDMALEVGWRPIQ